MKEFLRTSEQCVEKGKGQPHDHSNHCLFPFFYFRRLANTKGEIRVGVSHQVKKYYILVYAKI